MSGAQNVAFPRKLYDMIESEPDRLIEWANHGNAFFIRDQDDFCKDVLAKYFRHTKLTSFQRQLNLYGFRRITKGPDTGAYSHPMFNRDGKHVDTIKRVVRKGGVQEVARARWNREGRNKHAAASGVVGASPTSPHSFPDGTGSTRTGTRGRAQSWAHLYNDEDEDDGEDEEDEDEEEDEEDEYHPSGRRRRPITNTYSKPYYIPGGNRGSRTRRSGVAGRQKNGSKTTDILDHSSGGGATTSGDSHVSAVFNGHTGGMSVPGALAAALAMPPPEPRPVNGYDCDSTSHSFPPPPTSLSRNSSLNASDAEMSDTQSFQYNGPSSFPGLVVPNLGRSVSALSDGASLAGSEQWQLDSTLGIGGECEDADLTALEELDQFNFEAAFGPTTILSSARHGDVKCSVDSSGGELEDSNTEGCAFHMEMD